MSYVLKLFPLYPFLAISADKPDAEQNDWSAWGEEPYLAYEDIVFVSTSEQADLSEDLTVTVIVHDTSASASSGPEHLYYLGLSPSNQLVFEGMIAIPNHVVAIWNESPSDTLIDVAADSVKIRVYHSKANPNKMSVVVT